jgi:RNA polymerase sigma factor (sigma-70 family)
MTDESIMEAVKNGNLQQVSVLFERHHKRVFNFLAKMTMDRELAEDLTQNVFLRILKYKNSYREGLRFQSWLYQVARNVFSDHYQMSKSRYLKTQDVEKLKDSIEEKDETSEQADREVLLHQSLAKLDVSDRELLVLTRFEQIKYEDVAVVMETTVANIKVKVHRAIAKLREHYFELEKTS